MIVDTFRASCIHKMLPFAPQKEIGGLDDLNEGHRRLRRL
jgi:hypothetical protein